MLNSPLEIIGVNSAPFSLRGYFSLPAILASLLLFAFALFQGLATSNARDFFIYRLGAQLALRGENPYDVPKVQQHVAEAYPEVDDNTREFVANCGYFLPPLAIWEFLPLAAMPMIAAKISWAIATGLAAFCIAQLPHLGRSSGARPLVGLAAWLVPIVLVLNPLTLVVVLVGQVSLISVGCIAAGLRCIEQRRPTLGAILWVLPFAKPHLALPLIPLLWFLAGWRAALTLIVLAIVLNLAGATLVGGSPRFLTDYFEYLGNAHKVVGFNRAELNPSITSWNRLLFSCGGPLVELSAATTLAGYAVWIALAFGRIAMNGTRPTAPWALAWAAVGAVLCSQVLVYELLILALAVPWICELFAASNRLLGWLAIGLMAVQLIPQAALKSFGFAFPPSLSVALLALLILLVPPGNARLRGAEKPIEG